MTPQTDLDNETLLNLLGQPKGQKQVMGPYANALQAPDPVSVPKPAFQKVADPLLPHQRLPELGGIPDRDPLGNPTSNTMPIGGAPQPVRETPSDAPRPTSLMDGQTATPITLGGGGVFGNLVAGASQLTGGAQKQSTSDAPTTTATGVQPSTFQGFTPKHAMEGFDFGREQNTGKSAKDAFAFLANQAPPPPLNDKAALGAWFKQYIEPGMNQLGHQVISVDGDKFRFKNWQGEFDVDFGRGAGAEGGALAWQVDDGSAQMSNGAYQPQGQGAATQLGAVRQPSAIDRILEEVQALQGGGATPMEIESLMELLRA